MSLCKETDFTEEEFGGWGRIRTGVYGFAGRCITTLPPSHTADYFNLICIDRFRGNEVSKLAHPVLAKKPYSSLPWLECSARCEAVLRKQRASPTLPPSQAKIAYSSKIRN